MLIQRGNKDNADPIAVKFEGVERGKFIGHLLTDNKFLRNIIEGKVQGKRG